MGLKNVLKKIGKVALTAAPYIAAPFTGGASLMATGLANKAVQKWSEHDAKDAISKGLAPSKFDSVLGKVGGISGLATSFMPTNALGSIGLLGNAAKIGGAASKAAGAGSVLAKAADAGSKVSKAASIAGKVKKVADIAIPAIGGIQAAKSIMSGGGDPRSSGIGPSAVPRAAGQSGNAPGFSYGSNNPNLADSINAGRQAAAKDQGFRKGYDVTTRIGLPDDEGKYETKVTRMPKINTDYASMGVEPPRRKRKSMINEDGTSPLAQNQRTLPVRRSAAVY